MKKLLLLLVFLSACGQQRGVVYGEQGVQGLPGLPGPTGPVGTNGLGGLDGEKGEKGDIGVTGPQGPQGAVGQDGQTGPQGNPGTDASDTTVVQLCPNLGVPSYPNNFLEVGFCITGKLYGVYSANGQAALTELPPGTYNSTAPQSCTIQILTNCEVVQL